MKEVCRSFWSSRPPGGCRVPILHPSLCRSSGHSLALVVQTTQHQSSDDPAAPGGATRRGGPAGVLKSSAMRPRITVVRHVLAQDLYEGVADCQSGRGGHGGGPAGTPVLRRARAVLQVSIRNCLCRFRKLQDDPQHLVDCCHSCSEEPGRPVVDCRDIAERDCSHARPTA
jgi:hypothetical protein